MVILFLNYEEAKEWLNFLNEYRIKSIWSEVKTDM